MLRIKRIKASGILRTAAERMAASRPWRELGLKAADCRRAVSAPDRKTFGAFSGKELAGHVTINMSAPLRGYIQVLFVSDDFRGQGVGRELLRFAEERIFRSSPNVFLCVSSFNKNARKFYARSGYIKAGCLKDFLIEGADEFLLRKSKGPLKSFRHSHTRNP